MANGACMVSSFILSYEGGELGRVTTGVPTADDAAVPLGDATSSYEILLAASNEVK